MRTARLLTVSQHVLLGGVPAKGGVPAGGCTYPGVYLPRGCTFPGGVPAQVSSPVNRMTDRCKNITLPQTSFAGGNKNYECTNLIEIMRLWKNLSMSVHPVASWWLGRATNS